jgi:hypothetical protein
VGHVQTLNAYWEPWPAGEANLALVLAAPAMFKLLRNPFNPAGLCRWCYGFEGHNKNCRWVEFARTSHLGLDISDLGLDISDLGLEQSK